jgi:HD-like signal output (HDOD) protein
MADAVSLASVEFKTIDQWIALMGAAQLPVLGTTLREIARMRADEENVRPRDLAQVVLHDPLMAVRVLRFIKEKQAGRAATDITTVEHAIMMLGVSPFFRTFSKLRSVDTDLAKNNAALLGLMGVIGRARHAAMHAREWAQLRYDIDSDEVVIATLLHDLAEMLLWYFAPALAAQIEASLAEDPGRRSVDVQRKVLGFSLNDLQLAVAAAWQLPPILTSLMDSYRAEHPRARNVLYAVNLVRHAGHGWEDAALPDDIQGVCKLLGRPRLEVRQRIFHTALAAGLDHAWYGERTRAAWLPPFPLEFDTGDLPPGPRTSSRLLEKVKKELLLDNESGLLAWSASGVPAERTPAPALPAIVALVFYGLYKGLGLARQAYFAVEESGLLARARYLGGVRNSARLASALLPLGMTSPTTRELVEQGALWWKGSADSRPPTDLPNAWRSCVGQGFFACMIRTGDGRGGLLLADADELSMHLTENQFAAFREMADLLSLKLAGPIPELDSPEASSA